MMYRGKVVKKPGGGAGSRIPGASGSGARAGQFRGASTQKSGGKGSGDVRAILERLNGLYKDGLITKTEYDRKRQQILDRL